MLKNEKASGEKAAGLPPSLSPSPVFASSEPSANNEENMRHDAISSINDTQTVIGCAGIGDADVEMAISVDIPATGSTAQNNSQVPADTRCA